MNAFIFMLVCLAFSNGCFSAVNFNCNNRPGWNNKINEDFIERSILFKQYTICGGTHLAHVLSWNAICETLELLFNMNDFYTMQIIVDLLFEVDNEAVIWIEDPSTNFTTKKSIPHHMYMGDFIVSMNYIFHDSALNIVNAWKNDKGKAYVVIKEFLALVNSAPANLRQGDPRINCEIGKFLDPMDGAGQQMTNKEKHWNQIIGHLPCKPVKPMTICTRCHCIDACKTSSASIDDENYYVCL